MLDLEGPRLKIRRAKSEIERLRLSEDAFRQNTVYHVAKAEVNPKSGNDVYRVRIEGQPPSLDWGIYIGEIAHNLRSALDQLIYQLVLHDSPGKTPTTDTEFPIFLFGTSKRKRCNLKGKLVQVPTFEKDGCRKIDPLSKKHQTMIERLQPYHRWNRSRLRPRSRKQRGSRNSPLWWLHEINNADKHRLIQVVVPKRAAIGFGHWGGTNPSIRHARGVLKDGAKLVECSPGVHVNPTVQPLIAFNNRCGVVAELGVHFALSEIADTIDSIIESFASEFPQRSPPYTSKG